MKSYLAVVVFSSFVFACSSVDRDNGNRDSGNEVDAGDAGGGDDGPKPPGPSESIQANVSFLLKSVSPNEAFKANTSYDFNFELEIQSSQDEQLHLVPRIDAGWAAVVQGTDKIDVTMASALVALKVTKVITVTTGAAGTANLVLNLDGTKFRLFTQSSQPTRIALGATPTIPSNEILFRHVTTIGNQSAFRNNTVFVKRQQTGNYYLLSALALFKTAGTHKVSAPTADPSADWPVERTTSASVIHDADQNSVITLKFTPKNSGGQVTAADGQVSFTVTSADGLLSVPFSAQLRVVDALPSAP